MTDTQKNQNKDIEDNPEKIKNAEESSGKSTPDEPSPDKTSESIDELLKLVDEANDKHIRLYADFENYKKITARNKEELLKYANEEIMSDTLTVIDHLELALQHSSEDHTPSDSLAQGVELTLKELKTVLEKHGLTSIDAMGKPFDPSVHHAMSQIESDDADENTVIKEFRKGYTLKGRVLRAALVGVAVKPVQSDDTGSDSNPNETVATDENSK
jgi:molecular chaperone GrpE